MKKLTLLSLFSLIFPFSFSFQPQSTSSLNIKHFANKIETNGHSCVTSDIVNMGWDDSSSEEDYFLTLTRDDSFTYFYFKFPVDTYTYRVQDIGISIKDEFNETDFTYNDDFYIYDLELVSSDIKNYQKYICTSENNQSLLTTSRIVIQNFRFTKQLENSYQFFDYYPKKETFIFGYEDTINNISEASNKIQNVLCNDYIIVNEQKLVEQIIMTDDITIVNPFNIEHDNDAIAVDVYYYFFNLDLLEDIIDSIYKVEVQYSSFSWNASCSSKVDLYQGSIKYKSYNSLSKLNTDPTTWTDDVYVNTGEKTTTLVTVKENEVLDITYKNIYTGNKTFHFNRLFKTASQSDEWILENGQGYTYGCLFAKSDRFFSQDVGYDSSGPAYVNSTYIESAKLLKISYIKDLTAYENVAIYDEGAITEEGGTRDENDLIDDNVPVTEESWLDPIKNFINNLFVETGEFVGLIVVLIIFFGVIYIVYNFFIPSSWKPKGRRR